MAGLSNLTSRANQVFLAEELAWTHTQLTANNLLIEAIVTINHNLIDACLLALINSHLQIDRIALDVSLGGNKLEEEVTIVHIHIGNGIVVLDCALIEQFLIIDITLLKAQNLIQHRGGINGVAHPVDIRDIIFLTLVDLEVDVDALVVIVGNTIPHNHGITIAFLVILVDDALLVFLEIGAHKFLLAKPLQNVKDTTLVGLLHCAFYLAVAKNFVALNVNLVHIYLLMLVDNNINNHLVLLTKVFLLINFACCLLKALSSIIFLYYLLYATSDVGCDLTSHKVAKAFGNILLLAFLHA